MDFRNQGHVCTGKFSLQGSPQAGQSTSHNYDIMMEAHTKILGKKAITEAIRTARNKITPTQNNAFWDLVKKKKSTIVIRNPLSMCTATRRTKPISKNLKTGVSYDCILCVKASAPHLEEATDQKWGKR